MFQSTLRISITVVWETREHHRYSNPTNFYSPWFSACRPLPHCHSIGFPELLNPQRPFSNSAPRTFLHLGNPSPSRPPKSPHPTFESCPTPSKSCGPIVLMLRRFHTGHTLERRSLSLQFLRARFHMVRATTPATLPPTRAQFFRSRDSYSAIFPMYEYSTQLGLPEQGGY